MKILMVTDRMKCGGAESHILTLADALTQRGHTVHLTFDGGEMAQRVQHPVHPLPFMQRTPAGAAACIRGLARLQRQEGYDVIHAHARRSPSPTTVRHSLGKVFSSAGKISSNTSAARARPVSSRLTCSSSSGPASGPAGANTFPSMPFTVKQMCSHGMPYSRCR